MDFADGGTEINNHQKAVVDRYDSLLKYLFTGCLLPRFRRIFI